MTNNDELAQELEQTAVKANEHACFTMAVHTQQILALLAERDADKKRIAELEARQLDVIVPPRRCFDYAALAVQQRDEQWHNALHDACNRTGIKLEVGE